MRRPSCPLGSPGGAFPPRPPVGLLFHVRPLQLGVLQRPSYEHLSSQLSGSTFHTPIPLLIGTPILDFPNASHPKKQKRKTASQGPGTLPWTLGTPAHSRRIQTPFPQVLEPLNSEISHFDSKARKSAPIASHGTPQVPENPHCLQNQDSQDPTPKARNLRLSSSNKPGIPQHSGTRNLGSLFLGTVSLIPRDPPPPPGNPSLGTTTPHSQARKPGPPGAAPPGAPLSTLVVLRGAQVGVQRGPVGPWTQLRPHTAGVKRTRRRSRGRPSPGCGRSSASSTNSDTQSSRAPPAMAAAPRSAAPPPQPARGARPRPPARGGGRPRPRSGPPSPPLPPRRPRGGAWGWARSQRRAGWALDSERGGGAPPLLSPRINK